MTYELDIDGRCIRSEDWDYLVELNCKGAYRGKLFEIKQSRMNNPDFHYKQIYVRQSKKDSISRQYKTGKSKAYLMRTYRLSQGVLNNILKPGE